MKEADKHGFLTMRFGHILSSGKLVLRDWFKAETDVEMGFEA